ncbi:dimethyl sulfoxide reductase anchor subunit family protein [Aggregatilinea lenta]|uniref:dimethyl sulfoxide reductase anchor subunit family protein n=1 Tax=Aggregatilinea lenta TaxID=913108 RepID=UPI000E5B3871|nr:DmsC/YnfH family molybdoenzyme membrane anchor subunit [Aggregatilinea lenta]
MNTKEWALIAYTILTQMSVGAFFILGLVHTYALRKSNEKEADALSDRALLAIGPAIVLGVIVSLLHLGNPVNAYRAIFNIDSSWLSREILATVLFTGLGAVFAFLQWRKIATFQVRRILAVVTALAGLVLVFCMSQVYMLDFEPAWNTAATPITFFVTTFLLGGLAMGAAFVANYTYLKSKPNLADLSVQADLLRASLQGIALGAMVLVGIELIVMPLYVAYLSNGNAIAVESASKLTSEYGVIFALRLALGVIGAVLFSVFLYTTATLKKERQMVNFAYGAFAVVLIAEVLGRFLFYAIHLRMGL